MFYTTEPLTTGLKNVFLIPIKKKSTETSVSKEDLIQKDSEVIW